MTITIGQIAYANCTPIFSALTTSCDCSGYRFETGVPSYLNQRLRSGEIDICPSSSIEYAKHPASYYLLPELSISSYGPVRSVLLFSRLPLPDLDGQSIALTTESDTSVNLLKVLMAKAYRFRNSFVRTDLALAGALEQYSAVLMIGDAALRGASAGHELYTYDLGQLWYEFTRLPFVFALWIAHRDAVHGKRQDMAGLRDRLVAAKTIARASYEKIAATCAESMWMSPSDLVKYWEIISYDLTSDHLHGLNAFYGYCAEMGLVAERPSIRMFV